MEDDWSSGYSGYSFDTPLFISSLTQEAQGEWQKVNPKKAAKQPTCCDQAACHGHISRGRYDVLLDYDLPLMMIRSEEGDVPPGTDSHGGAVFVHETSTAKALKPEVKKIGAEEFRKNMEKYHHQHKARISKKVPSTFVKVWPEKRDDSADGAGTIPALPGNHATKVSDPLPLEPVTPVRASRRHQGELPSPAPGLPVPQHHKMYTPPSNSPGSATTVRDFEYPLPAVLPPSKKEERTIAQKNIANAGDNLRYLGLHLVCAPAEVVVSSNSSTKYVLG